MSTAASATAGFLIAAGVCATATPVAIALARRCDFLDHPRDYRKHARPTPLLGGLAIFLAFLAAGLLVGHWSERLAALLGGAAAMWLIGTVDDRVAVAPLWRVLAAAAAAAGLYAAGAGWHTSGIGPLDLLLTMIWVVGLVNAFNLMDNMDGACATVAAVAAAGVGALAAIDGRAAVAGVAFALCGACLVFLCWNLARPARIFLGDGGSMPVGFLVGALALLVSRHSPSGRAGIVVAAMLAGLPILDVTLVCLSRSRRGVTLMTGGRDHLSHRLALALGSPRRVAAALACGQAALCAAAVASHAIGELAVGIFGLVSFLLGVGVILVLDTPRWRPTGIAVKPVVSVGEATVTKNARVDVG